MKYTAGDRVKDVRELMGLTRQDFADLTKLDVARIRNLEMQRSKLNEDDFAAIGQVLPELLPWLAIEADVPLWELVQSQNKWLRVIAARVEAGYLPEGNCLIQSIKKGE